MQVTLFATPYRHEQATHSLPTTQIAAYNVILRPLQPKSRVLLFLVALQFFYAIHARRHRRKRAPSGEATAASSIAPTPNPTLHMSDRSRPRSCTSHVCRCETLCKGRVVPIPPGKRVSNSHVIHTDPADPGRANQIIQSRDTTAPKDLHNEMGDISHLSRVLQPRHRPS